MSIGAPVETQTKSNDELTEASNDELVETSVEKKRGLNKWQVVAIILMCLLVATLLAMLIYNLIKNQQQDQEQQKDSDNKNKGNNGIVVEDEKNTDSNINVDPTGETTDINGNEINLGSEIVNNTDINLSKDAELAVAIETNGSSNLPITVNGERVYGRVMIDDGIATWYDAQNVKHTAPYDQIAITYGGSTVDKNVINLMNDITYDKTGNMIFKDCKTVINYDDNKNVTISYQNDDGNSYGSTSFENVTKDSNGAYYSNGELLDQKYQDLFVKYDKLVGNTAAHDNSQAQTNLTSTAISNQIG